MKQALLFRSFKAIFFCAVLIMSQHSQATVWTTMSAGSITTLSNWTNGSTSPTTFTTPGDTWNITMAMTISSSGTWTVGTASMTPVTVTLGSGGSITCGAGGAMPTLNIYGNFNLSGGSYSISGGAATPTVSVYGNSTITSGDITVNGGGAHLIYNSHGTFDMSGGNFSVFGGGAINTLNMFGNTHFSGGAYIVSSGGGATGELHFSLPSASGTMLIGNTSTGSWSAMTTQVDAGCAARLDSNFSTSTGGTGFTIYGSLDCPAGYVIDGTSNFTVAASGTLLVGHASGINSAITNSGSKTFNDTASYGFNGTVAQVTGTWLPAALYAPSKLMVNNTAGVTLSQSTATTGALDFTAGILNTATFTMTTPGAASSVTGAGTSSFVNGTLIKGITGLTTLNYEVGDATYAPMQLTLSAAGSAGSFGLKVTAGMHPNVATSGISTTQIANHYWTISDYGGTGPATVVPMATYNAADITGGVNYYFRTQEYTSSAWLGSPLATTNTVSPYTSAPVSGISLSTLAGDYIFGTPTAALSVANMPAKGMVLYPNPCNGSCTLSISSPADEKIEVVITDVCGREIIRVPATTNTQVNFALHVAPGIYYAAAHTSAGTFTATVTVE